MCILTHFTGQPLSEDDVSKAGKSEHSEAAYGRFEEVCGYDTDSALHVSSISHTTAVCISSSSSS